MTLNLWWAFNDGMTGHVFLGPRELELLRQEMILQGMAPAFPVEKLVPNARIRPQEIEGALEHASPDPLTIQDRKLWQQWLEFLDGARHKGGLIAR